jgi:cyclopropane fatty-acyl-phospholipid synthase-like methyltransferase
MTTSLLGDAFAQERADARDGYFDELVAARYDEDTAQISTPEVIEPIVDLLAQLAGEGRALELAIGTGRIALPLSQRGVEVHGIELSRAMAARLREKPGGGAIGVTIGDMASMTVPGRFRVAYIVANSIGNLTTQQAQVACFRNVAAHLEPGGSFVVELIVPDLQWLPPGERTRTFHFSDDHVGIDEYDLANQRLTSHHWKLRDGRWERFSVPFRYVWPAELDLMAQLAGMQLRERWAGWKREPFESDSRRHVSVWETPKDAQTRTDDVGQPAASD